MKDLIRSAVIPLIIIICSLLATAFTKTFFWANFFFMFCFVLFLKSHKLARRLGQDKKLPASYRFDMIYPDVIRVASITGMLSRISFEYRILQPTNAITLQIANETIRDIAHCVPVAVCLTVFSDVGEAIVMIIRDLMLEFYRTEKERRAKKREADLRRRIKAETMKEAKEWYDQRQRAQEQGKQFDIPPPWGKGEHME